MPASRVREEALQRLRAQLGQARVQDPPKNESKDETEEEEQAKANNIVHGHVVERGVVFGSSGRRRRTHPRRARGVQEAIDKAEDASPPKNTDAEPACGTRTPNGDEEQQDASPVEAVVSVDVLSSSSESTSCDRRKRVGPRRHLARARREKRSLSWHETSATSSVANLCAPEVEAALDAIWKRHWANEGEAKKTLRSNKPHAWSSRNQQHVEHMPSRNGGAKMQENARHHWHASGRAHDVANADVVNASGKGLSPAEKHFLDRILLFLRKHGFKAPADRVETVFGREFNAKFALAGPPDSSAASVIEWLQHQKKRGLQEVQDLTL